MSTGYKTKMRYNYTKDQAKLIELQKRYRALTGVKGIGAWLQRVGIRWQVKGLLMILKVKDEKGYKDI